MIRIGKLLLACVLVLSLSLASIACTTGEEETQTPQTQYIKMGSSLPLTGMASYLGLPRQRAIDFVIEEFNEAGGIAIDGVMYLIDMTWYDDAYDPVRGRTNVEKLIYEDDVDYLVGLFTSTFSTASSIALENKVLVTTTATGGEEVINPERRYIFRPYMDSTVGAYTTMKWLVENYDIERFAFLQIDSKGSRDVTEMYQKACDKLGVETSVVYHSVFDADYYPMLTSLLADDPDLLFVGPDALKQARQLGYTGKVTGMLSTVDVSRVVGTAGVDNAEGYLMSLNLDWNITPEAVEFHDKYLAKYGQYDAQALSYVGLIEIILQGIEKADSVDPTDVMTALDQMAEVNEPIHLPIGDAYWAGASRYGGVPHQLVWPIHIMDIHDGEARLLAVLPPPSEEDLLPLE
ncbi:MAG: ABC transporter substrate-binding protein [Dehalococcoidia bacterium]|nr:MAG: ABC transporter substrate-binding protein [Dehalococcoidia bacterium]